MMAALPYDSTAYQGNNIPNGQPGSRTDPFGAGIFWQYIGWYAGHSGLNVQKPRLAMVHNAFLSYNYKKDKFSFGVKGGAMMLKSMTGSLLTLKGLKALSNTKTPG